MRTNCRGCGSQRKAKQYLCVNCWDRLQPWVRAALSKSDHLAGRRGAQLFDQLRAGRLLAEVEVTP